MRRDIPIHEVTEVGLALVPEDDHSHSELWGAYLVNLKDHPLKSILVNVQGLGDSDGNLKRTASVRYFIEEIEPLGAHKIEVMLPEIMTITNQFWISFSHNNYLYDKKFIVPSDAPDEMELIGIPVLHCPGLWFD